MSTPTNTWPHGPCVVCGEAGEQEPRFLYFICKAHENMPPVTCVKPQRCMLVQPDTEDPYLGRPRCPPLSAEMQEALAASGTFGYAHTSPKGKETT